MQWQAGGELHAIGERLFDQQVSVLRLAGEERIASQVGPGLTLARIERKGVAHFDSDSTTRCIANV